MLAVALHWKPGHESGIDLLFLLSRKQSITWNKISTVNKKWYPFIEQCHSGFQQQSYYSINWTLHIGFHVCMYAYQYPWLLISGTINSSLPCYGTGQLEGERKAQRASSTAAYWFPFSLFPTTLNVPSTVCYTYILFSPLLSLQRIFLSLFFNTFCQQSPPVTSQYDASLYAPPQ